MLCVLETMQSNYRPNSTSAKVQIYFGMTKVRVEWAQGGGVVGNGWEVLRSLDGV